MKNLKKFVCNLDVIISGLSLCAIVAITLAGVIMRKIMNQPIAWLEEIQLLLFIYAIFFGGSVAFRYGNQVSIDLVMNRLKGRDKDFAVISGNDSLILSALKEGGVGGIAGCANVYPHNMVAIYEKFKAGDLEGAQAAQDAIASFRACFKYGNPNTIVKTAVGLLGYPVGKCRKPFYSMSEEGVAALKAVLEENKRNGMN